MDLHQTQDPGIEGPRLLLSGTVRMPSILSTNSWKSTQHTHRVVINRSGFSLQDLELLRETSMCVTGKEITPSQQTASLSLPSRSMNFHRHSMPSDVHQDIEAGLGPVTACKTPRLGGPAQCLILPRACCDQHRVRAAGLPGCQFQRRAVLVSPSPHVTVTSTPDHSSAAVRHAL